MALKRKRSLGPGKKSGSTSQKRRNRRLVKVKPRQSKDKFVIVMDIGNTDTSVAVFKDSEINGRFRFSTRQSTADDMELLIDKLCKKAGYRLKNMSGAAVAYVVPDAGSIAIKALLRHVSQFMDVNSPDVRNTILVDYHPPKSVGADRIANAVAVQEIYGPGKPKIVVDFGTATTFDCIGSDGTYRGGVIHPGVELAAQSLYDKTAMLPRVSFKPVNNVLGKDTQSSIRSGLFYGIVGAVKEILAALEYEMGPAIRIGTGGAAVPVCM